VPLDRVFSTLSSGILYEVFPMDMRCTPTSAKFPMSLKALGDIIREHLQIYPTILTEYAREELAWHDFERDCDSWYFTLAMQEIQERYNREIIDIYISTEYNQERYAWYDYEDDCDDWYMDSCHFWDETTFIFYLMTLLHLL
jgi:hypothetical protein